MKTIGMQSHYDQFTLEERILLSLAAAARGDDDENARLCRSCLPADTEACTRLRAQTIASLVGFFDLWLDLSHHVVRTRESLRLVEYLAFVTKAVPPAARKKLGMLGRRELHALQRKLQAKHRETSAIWKAFEAAITRFCGERGLPTQKLFAILPTLPLTLDEARANLDVDVSADPEIEALMYRRLCDAVSTSTSPQGE